MLGEDVDMGFYAEDAYAAYVTQIATSLGLVPEFCNARGALVDVVFTGPFLSAYAFEEAALSLREREAAVRDVSPAVHQSGDSSKRSNTAGRTQAVWERLAEVPRTSAPETVVLHAWIEKLNAHLKVQLTEPTQLLRPEEVQERDCGLVATEKEDAPGPKVTSTAHRRVLGDLDFLLHLSTRDLLLGESNRSDDPLSMDAYDGCPVVDENHGEGTGLDEVGAACAVRDTLEQQDAIAVARNAVDTVIKFARLAEEHPGQTATVCIDEAGGEETLQFDR